MDPRMTFNAVGRAESFRLAMEQIARVAATQAPILIEGETGTGKEMAARGVHYLGTRRNGPFIPVNCGALPDGIVESELFGHDRGAFTDAREKRSGLVAQAAGGTLFLDEVDALSTKGQVVLLRFLQDQRYRPLGARGEVDADVRVVAATNADLAAAAADKRFRIDLFYRLNVLTLRLPALRERRGDACLLAEHFLQQYSRHYQRRCPHLHPETAAWLDAYPWPGNVRELENLIHREFLLCDTDVLRIAPPGDALAPEGGAADGGDFRSAKADAIAAFERRYLARCLADAGGNITLAAQRCGKERRAFGKLLKKHRIDKRSFLAA